MAADHVGKKSLRRASHFGRHNEPFVEKTVPFINLLRDEIQIETYLSAKLFLICIMRTMHSISVADIRNAISTKGPVMNRQKGFTLLELLTTLAVSALMLSMAVPSVQAFSNNSRQTSATNEFVSSMHQARSTAITSNARVTMCASSNGASCATVAWNQGWIVFADTDSDQTVDAGERIIGSSASNDELDIQSGEFADFLTFRPNGRVTNAGVNAGEITFCDGRGSSHAKVVIVDLSGRPRTSDTKANGAAPSCP